jgi:hypothetical protein
MKQVYRFTFPRKTPPSQIEQALSEAIHAVECIHGPNRVRLGMGYYMSKGQCVIDTETEVGRQVAQVFTGLISRELGEDGFSVERVAPSAVESAT